MPWMQAFVERMNVRFNRSNMGQVNPAFLAPGNTLEGAARDSNLTNTPTALNTSVEEEEYLQEFLGHFSEADRQTLRQVLYDAFKPTNAADRLPVQFLWAPSDDGNYHMDIWRVKSGSAVTPPSKTAISVLLRSPQTAKEAPTWEVEEDYHATGT